MARFEPHFSVGLGAAGFIDEFLSKFLTDASITGFNLQP
jgi:hypothetical protein